MVYVHTQIKIPGYGIWKSAFEGKLTKRKESGSKGYLVFRNSDAHDEIVILFRWDNMENAHKYFESDFKNILLDSRSKLINIIYLDELETKNGFISV